MTFPYEERCGALHLHTNLSDGGVTLPELVSTASEIGLDYLVVTDHMTLDAKDQRGFHGDVLVEIGYEHHDQKERNHYLALGTSSVGPRRTPAQEYVDFVHSEGGLGFIAHPMERRHYFRKFPPYPWTAWEVENFDGIELWNQMSDWMERLRSWRSIVRIFFPRRFMADPPRSLRRKWDAWNRERFVPAIGGVDAHSRRYGSGLISFTIFPIKVELKGIRTHLYFEKPPSPESPDDALKALRNALANGHGFISNYRRGDARGSKFYLTADSQERRGPGLWEHPVRPPATLIAELPQTATINLIRNGWCIGSQIGTKAAFPVDRPGVYRFEVRRAGKGWIYTNPFPVGDYPL